MPTEDTSASLRDMLFDEIRQLRSGGSDPARAKSVALLADKIIKSAEVEMEFQRLKKEQPDAGVEPLLLTQRK